MRKLKYLAFAGGTGVAGSAIVAPPSAPPDPPIRIGLVGDKCAPCSAGRGVGACANAIAAADGVSVAAFGSVLAGEVDQCRKLLEFQHVDLPKERFFFGWDAYEKVLAIPEVNYAILSPEAHFRPQYLRAAIAAGKHAYVTPPVAVDGPGVRSVMATAELARKKGLGILVGYQRHFQPNYAESIRRLQDGAVGTIRFCEASWNQGCLGLIQARRPGWSDMEMQLRNWMYFTWLSGDCILSLHSSNLDVINWLLQAHPLRAFGMGGRQATPEADQGDSYDHFSVEYEYANGVRLFSQCRVMDGCRSHVGERVTGTAGTSNCMNEITGRNPWRRTGKFHNPYEQEHVEFIRSIREGRPLNNAVAAAETALTAIMGREAAYSGQEISWEAALHSTRRLGPERYEFGALPSWELPVPGRYRFH